MSGYGPPRPTKGPAFYIGVALCVGCGAVVIFGAVLAAVMLPVFMQARNKASTTLCLSNLKQNGMALSMYAQDYDSSLPRADGWMDSVTPYSRTEAALHCPVVRRQNPSAYGYAYNTAIAGASMMNVADPASTLSVYDSTLLTRSASDQAASQPRPGRHGSGSRRGNNVAYVDGHAKMVSD